MDSKQGEINGRLACVGMAVSYKTIMLTKTAYLAYTQCPKQFWLDAHQPHLATPPDPVAQRRLQGG